MGLAGSGKLGREARRIYKQLDFIVRQVPYDLYVRLMQDKGHALSRFCPIKPQLGPRIAVFVVYQPSGVPLSVDATLKLLRGQGFDILLVSNGALGDTDRARLAGRVDAILERPNLGYDFGAYQHGIRLIGAAGWACDELLLMNDSVFCPLFEGSDIVERLRAIPGDFCGVVQNEFRNAPRSFHLGSFMLLFRNSALTSEAFTRFWSAYMPWTSRNHAIKHGELALSQSLRGAGLVAGCAYAPEALAQVLQTMPAQEVRRACMMRVIRKRSDISPEYTAHLAAFADNERWRDVAVRLLCDDLAVNIQPHMAASLYPVFLGAGFLKKDIMRLPEFSEQIMQDLSLAQRPIAPQIRHDLEKVLHRSKL